MKKISKRFDASANSKLHSRWLYYRIKAINLQFPVCFGQNHDSLTQSACDSADQQQEFHAVRMKNRVDQVRAGCPEEKAGTVKA